MTNEDYILAHRSDDVRRLALTKAPDGIDHRWCLQQIEGWQLAQRKLPQWAQTEGLWYPPRLSMEQCSSEDTALYKREVIERLIPETERTAMADLTGGLGVDFSYLVPLFREATYVEILPELRKLAEHNLPLLGLPNATISEPDNSSFCTLHSSFLFIDPARRDTAGRKTVDIEDCTPNLLELQDQLLANAQWVMVKLSPMLDISQALRKLKNVSEIHVVSLHGECKELLFVLSHDVPQSSTIYCVNLGTDEDVMTSPYPLPRRGHEPPQGNSCKKKDSKGDNPPSLGGARERFLSQGYNCEEKDGKVVHAPSLGGARGRFLYEPNTSILKAGMQDLLCERYGVQKLHPMSHLFVGPNFIPHFPGRRFRIMGMSDFGKKNLKALIGDLHQANLTIRNFPTNVATLRRQLKLAEGGNDYLFATTLADGQRVLIRTQHAEPSE